MRQSIGRKSSAERIAKARSVEVAYYQSKGGTSTKTFDTLGWLAQLTIHIRIKGEQMLRYYGFYSNKSQGLRKKAGTDDQVPALIESEATPKEFRQSWLKIVYCPSI